MTPTEIVVLIATTFMPMEHYRDPIIQGRSYVVESFDAYCGSENRWCNHNRCMGRIHELKADAGAALRMLKQTRVDANAKPVIYDCVGIKTGKGD